MTVAKLQDTASLQARLEEARAAGQRIVLTSGCFDLLHIGHVRSLRHAREQGDLLIVGLNSDQSVRGLKGEGRPWFTAEERAELLSALDMVDWIVVVPELTMDRALRQLRPHVFAKGTDYDLQRLPERETVQELGIELAIVGDAKERSTGQFRVIRP